MRLNPADYSEIEIERRDNGVVVAALNRPHKLNVINIGMHEELATVVRDFDADRDCKVLVLTGKGRAFCAGGEVSETVGKGFSLREARLIIEHLLLCRKPVISAVKGYAMGLGANMALLCDIVVAGDSAIFADTHVTMGVGAGDGGQLIWPLLMGVNKAKYYMMTGDRVDAVDAERMNLVNFVVPDDELMDKALEIADRLAAGPMRAIMASKVPINNYIRMVANQVLPLSLEMEMATLTSRDAREAALAFHEKRKPNFDR